MKYLLIIIFFFFLKDALGQNQCSCDSNLRLKDEISCKSILFHNKARLYRQYNCDSSWMVFQSKIGRKKILDSSVNELVDLTGRLGYSYVTEYRSTFLIQNNVISGCCDPPEFILFDKQTGNLKDNLGRLIFYSENSKYPVVMYLQNNNYKSFESRNMDNSFIKVLNVNSHKEYRIYLPKNRIGKTMKLTDEIFAEHLFDTEVKGNSIIIEYRYLTGKNNNKWVNSRIVVNRNSYTH